ncbi:hypothetical protein BLA29_012997, partial [Euroglyphus maynei]
MIQSSLSITLACLLVIAPAVLCQRPPQFLFNPSSSNQPSSLPYQPPANAPTPQPQPPRAILNQNSFQPSNNPNIHLGGGHVGGSSFQCLDDFGFYPHLKSCDKYWACDN